MPLISPVPYFTAGCKALLLCSLLAGTGARAQEAATPAPPADPVTLTLQSWLSETASISPPVALHQPEACKRFYRSRAFAPAWLTDAGRTPNSEVLLSLLRNAGREGLRAQDYHLDAIEQAGAATDTPDGRALLDLLLSDAFMHYANDLQTGRLNPRDLDPDWSIAPVVLADPATALDHALGHDQLLQGMEALAPTQPEYQRLRNALDYYRKLARQGGWPQVPEGDKLEAGDRSPRIEALRARLRVTGDWDGADAPDTQFYDPDLVAAVRRFQIRHGLDPDGVVGKRTLAALNVTADERVRQIEINMERWRWLPRTRERRHIVVNMMDYSLDVMEDGKNVMHMRVIVGQQYRSTPVIGSRLTHLVINPYWNVPISIAGKDLLPKIRRDPEAFANMGIKVFADWGREAQQLDPALVDWSAISAKRFPYKLRQEPGPGNSLGRIKFLLPNSYDIYLHDTPNRALFRRTERAFSSGCIRLEKPRELALYLLNGTNAWDPARLDAEIDSLQTRTLRLPEAVPIYLQYLTAWVDDAGQVQFRHDLYGRDERLARALAQSGTKFANNSVN